MAAAVAQPKKSSSVGYTAPQVSRYSSLAGDGVGAPPRTDPGSVLGGRINRLFPS